MAAANREKTSWISAGVSKETAPSPFAFAETGRTFALAFFAALATIGFSMVCRVDRV
jgi:hypothetical protein